jgi:hypothetical protein
MYALLVLTVPRNQGKTKVNKKENKFAKDKICPRLLDGADTLRSWSVWSRVHHCTEPRKIDGQETKMPRKKLAKEKNMVKRKRLAKKRSMAFVEVPPAFGRSRYFEKLVCMVSRSPLHENTKKDGQEKTMAKEKRWPRKKDWPTYSRKKDWPKKNNAMEKISRGLCSD